MMRSQPVEVRTAGSLALVVDDISRRSHRRHILALGLLTPVFALLALSLGI